MEQPCKNTDPAASEEPRCAVDDVPDDLLRLILLRLDSPLWLVRAACACKRWRRIVGGADGGRAFLRLASSLHPPVVLGHCHGYYGGGYRFVPSSPTPPIRLSLDFFPREFVRRHRTIKRWYVADCHGGLVLLREGLGRVSDLVVCELLSRRYREIHHPPFQTTPSSIPLPSGSFMPRVFLLDGGDEDGNISISHFRVLYCSFSNSEGSKVCIFSTANGGYWRLVWQSRAAVNHDDLFDTDLIGRIDGSLYMASTAGSVKVLDNIRLVFSDVNLPMREWKSCLHYVVHDSTFAVVHGASPEPTASPATVSIVHVRGEDLVLFRRNPSSGEWVLKHSIPQLSKATRGLQGYPERSRWLAVNVIAGGTRLAVLKASLIHGNRNWSWLFSFDVDTMQLQVVSDMDVATYLSSDTTKPLIYTLPWPQFLSTALES